MDTFGKADPFVRLYMLPDKHEVNVNTHLVGSCLTISLSGVEDQGDQEEPQPNIQRVLPVQSESNRLKWMRKLNPKVPLADVTKKTIVLQVFDWDKITKTDGIGEVQIPLWQLNLATETNEWKALHKITGTPGKVGSVIL